MSDFTDDIDWYEHPDDEPEDDFSRDEPDYGCDTDGDATHWIARKADEYQRLEIRQMTDSHLLNAIAYLDRLRRAAEQELLELAGEAFGHDFDKESMAAYYAEQEGNHLLNVDPPEHPAYSGLRKEAVRRGLIEADE